MKHPARLSAVKIERSDQRGGTTDKRNQRETALILDQEIYDDDEENSYREDKLRVKETQAADVLEIHGLAVQMRQNNLVDLVHGRTQHVEHHGRIDTDNDDDHAQWHQSKNFPSVDLRYLKIFFIGWA